MHSHGARRELLTDEIALASRFGGDQAARFEIAMGRDACVERLAGAVAIAQLFSGFA